MGFRYEVGFLEASKRGFGPSRVDFGTSQGSHFGAMLGQKSIFLRYQKGVLNKKLFEGAPSTEMEAKTALVEAVLGAFWGPCWKLVQSQKC